MTTCQWYSGMPLMDTLSMMKNDKIQNVVDPLESNEFVKMVAKG